MSSIPSYDDLPRADGIADGCAWPLWSKDGQIDVYGCLNKITQEVVTAAAAEVKDGVSISLNWPMGAIKKPAFSRKALRHNVFSFLDSPLKIHGFDDEVEFNTQASSQWDSLCHYHHQQYACAYSGARPSLNDFQNGSVPHAPKEWLPTLDHWHKKGGLVTRGVLIDYKAYADSKGIKYSPFSAHIISIETVEEIAKLQGVEFRPGDVLIMRTGLTEELEEATEEDQVTLLGTHKSVGMESTMKAVKWVWNNHFSAVACDNVGFEVWSATKDVNGVHNELIMHQHFLGLLGIHIGEYWDLKELSQYCAKRNRYTFMLSSIPLNIPSLVASPPNAIAVF